MCLKYFSSFPKTLLFFQINEIKRGKERKLFLGKIVTTELYHDPVKIYYSLGNSAKRNLNLDTSSVLEGDKEQNPS